MTASGVEPTPIQRAWMAGFVDGEGCLTISRQKRKGRPSPAYRVFISVSNTCKKVLFPFKKNYGGYIYSIHERRKDLRGIKWADAFDWYCPIRSAEKILKDIRPYLVIKKRQADLLLKFIHTKNGFKRTHWPGWGKGSAPLSDSEIRHRERIRMAVHKLNHKGQDFRMSLGR